MSISQISPGRKNSLVYEIDGSDGAWAWDCEQPDQAWIGHRDRPNEILIRNPALMGAGRPGRVRPAGRPRRGLLRHLLRPFPGRLRGRGSRGGPPPTPGYPTFADGHDEMLVGEAIARSAREGRWVDVDRPDAVAAARPSPRRHAR